MHLQRFTYHFLLHFERVAHSLVRFELLHQLVSVRLAREARLLLQLLHWIVRMRIPGDGFCQDCGQSGSEVPLARLHALVLSRVSCGQF